MARPFSVRSGRRRQDNTVEPRRLPLLRPFDSCFHLLDSFPLRLRDGLSKGWVDINAPTAEREKTKRDRITRARQPGDAKGGAKSTMRRGLLFNPIDVLRRVRSNEILEGTGTEDLNQLCGRHQIAETNHKPPRFARILLACNLQCPVGPPGRLHLNPGVSNTFFA
jgi:hypothetical protein